MSQLSLLSVDEKIRLSHLEQKIEAGRRAVWEMAQALLEVRDRRLYRESYGTFEAYCDERWDISRPFAYNLIAASKVYANVCGSIHPPQNEYQVRPLAALSPEQQSEAWEAATAIADGAPTSSDTKRVAEAVKTKSDRAPIQAGQTVEVGVEESPLYGQTVRVERVKGVLAWVEGRDKPFLVDELVEVPQRESVPPPAPMPNNFELLQARYERASARVEIVESLLLDLMAAVEEGDTGKALEVTAQARELFI